MKISKETMEQINRNTLYTTLGIRLEEVGKGWARAVLRPDPKLCWPFPGQPHGGILFTLMDTTMAFAVLTHLDPGFKCTTIDLNIHYTRPARGEWFSCRAEILQRTNRLSFPRSEIYNSQGEILALGQGTYRVIAPKIAGSNPAPATM